MDFPRLKNDGKIKIRFADQNTRSGKRRAKKDLYANASVFAYPSFYEGFGFPPLEAMAFGVPVIASSSASLGEILGNAALLVQPYQTAELAAAISNILNDENLRNVYAQRGLELAKDTNGRTRLINYPQSLKALSMAIGI